MSDLPIINVSTADVRRTVTAVDTVRQLVLGHIEKEFSKTEPTGVDVSFVTDGTEVWVARVEFGEEFFVAEGVATNLEHLRVRGPFENKPKGRPPGAPDQALNESVRQAIEAYRSAPKIKLDDERKEAGDEPGRAGSADDGTQ